jgi:hypothetical protein
MLRRTAASSALVSGPLTWLTKPALCASGQGGEQRFVLKLLCSRMKPSLPATNPQHQRNCDSIDAKCNQSLPTVSEEGVGCQVSGVIV